MPRPNDTIGPYTLIRKLGSGSFGVVWLAEKRSQLLTTKVALKIARDEGVELAAIRKEAAVWLEAGGHPNILPIIDADIYEDQAVIVSEYAPGGSLTDWLFSHGGKAPSIRSALTMIDGVLAGLEHLHTRNIIHRDLKPDNILLAGTIPRLADFGIARILKTTGPYTTFVSGTPQYMAPEAYKGRRSEQTDLWSAGVVLYQLLAGCCPFFGEDPPALMYAVLTEDPKPLPASIPVAVQEVITKALDKQSEGRYQTAHEMRDAIKSVRAFDVEDGRLQDFDNQAVTITDVPPILPHTPDSLSNHDEPMLTAIPPKKSVKEIQLEYWAELDRILRKNNSVVRLDPARPQSSIRGFLGHPKVELFAVATVKNRKISAGVRIFNRPDIYRALEKERASIEGEMTRSDIEELSWRGRKNFQTISEISLSLHGANIEWRERWSEYLEWHRKTLEAFFKSFEPRVKTAVKAATSALRSATPRGEWVGRFWEGFESRRIQTNNGLQLNKPIISNSGGGKSYRTESLGNGFVLAAQINSSKDYVDVNITAGSKQYDLFEALRSSQREIESRIPGLHWKSNPNGESWVIVQRDFNLSDGTNWEETYDWLLENLRLFHEVFSPLINSLNSTLKLEPQKSLESLAEADTSLTRLAQSVGMTTFVSYYDQFGNFSLPNHEIVEMLPQQFTLKSRQSRTSHARRIFKDGMETQALELILTSPVVDIEARNLARELLNRERRGDFSVENDKEAVGAVMVEANRRQFWIVLWGDPEHSDGEDEQIFNRRYYDQGFPLKPTGVRIGDVFFVHRIHVSKIIYVAEVLALPRQSTALECEREPWRKKWRWSVTTKNLTRDYGTHWRSRGQRTFDLLHRYNELNPTDPDKISALKFGRHVRIQQGFAEFLVKELLSLS